MSVQKTEIKITIDKNGNISYKVKGLKGKDCVKSTQFLDDDLGDVTNREYTREYYEHKVRTTHHVEAKR